MEGRSGEKWGGGGEKGTERARYWSDSTTTDVSTDQEVPCSTLVPAGARVLRNQTQATRLWTGTAQLTRQRTRVVLSCTAARSRPVAPAYAHMWSE
eukprot:745945-Rhodomonas_salina.1